MEQRLSQPIIEQDKELLAAAEQVSNMTAEYCYGPGGVSEVLAGHEVNDLVRIANDPNASGSVFGSMAKHSVVYMQHLVRCFETLYPNEHEDQAKYEERIIAEAAQAVGMAEQVVIAEKLFEKVATEIDGPGGLSDATCDNLARYNPNNQKIVIDLTHKLYDKYIVDHKSGKNAQIIQHNGEAFSQVGGDLAVDVDDDNGVTKNISLDEYKVALVMNHRSDLRAIKHRSDLRKKLGMRSDPDLVASLQAVEDIPVHAWQQQLEDTVVPTRVGQSLIKIGHGAKVASTHAVRAAHETSQYAVDNHKKVVSTAALVGVAGTFGLSVIEPARAQAATSSANVAATSLYAANQAGTLPESVVSEVDGGLVVSASPVAQLTPVNQPSQEVNSGGVTIAEDSSMVLPANPQPVHSILPIKNETVQAAVTNAAANGNITAGALALANTYSPKHSEVPASLPVNSTIESINTTLANATAVPQEIVGVVRNMLIVSETALTDPSVLNTISADEWNVIKGGQDSAATQNAISQLTDKHVAILNQANSGLDPDMTPDQKQQLAELLASSEYYAATNPAPAVNPDAAPVAPAPAAAAKPAPHEKSPNSSPKPETSNLSATTEKALQAVIDRGGKWKNRGLAVRFLMRNGWTLTQAAGAVGNLMQESSRIDPNSEQQITDPSRGEGIAQWSKNARWQSLLDFAQANQLNPRKLDTQLRFILHELHGSQKHAYREIMAATTVHGATMAFSVFYERPGDPRNTHRVDNAQLVFDAVTEETKKISQQAPAQAPPVASPAPAPAPTTPDPAATPVTPPETSLAPTDTGGGLVIEAQPSQQTPDGAGNAAAPIDAPPTDATPAPQPPVDSPAPEAPPVVAAPAPDTAPAPETTPPVSVETQRTTEIARLEASGQFNRSQASPDAPRTPLEKTFRQQGEQNGKLSNVVDLGPQWPGRELSKPAAEAFHKLNDAFKAQFGHDIVLNDAYRNYANQVATKKDATDKGRPQFAATAGYSKHGWGLAIDMGGGMQSFNSNEAQWMMDNALNFGWNHPAFAAPDTTAPEPWHWEYVLSQ